MPRTLAVAGIQMKVVNGLDNIERMSRKLKEVCYRFPQLQLALFSELCVFGVGRQYAETIPGPTTNRLAELARQYRLWLVPGSMLESTPEGVYNTAPVFNPEGELVTKYRKMYPFEPYEKVLRGHQTCVFDIPGLGRLGLCTCYDQWFPELIRQLVWEGAEVVLNPVNTTTPDRPLEVVMTQALAIFNQVYFLSVNGLDHGGWGRSLLVDPEGRILHQAGEVEWFMTEVLDLDRVSRCREEGTYGLAQILKSFRDAGHSFAVYDQGPSAGPGFSRLGPLDPKNRT